MGLNRDLFNFSAKVGCLEGYLYERKYADISTLPNWVGNIEKMYRNLPEEIKRDFLIEYKHILEKILQSSEKILKKEDGVLTKLKDMIADIPSSLPWKRFFSPEQKNGSNVSLGKWKKTTEDSLVRLKSEIDHHLFERWGSSRLEMIIKKKGLKN